MSEQATYPAERARSIRRQLDLMAEIRDRMWTEGEDNFGRWEDALVPLTHALITELHEAECAAIGCRTNPWHTIHGHEPRPATYPGATTEERAR
jgi:hypothetical protein